MKNLAAIGKKIYDFKKWREYRRYLVFRLRAALNPRRMAEIDEYFQKDEVRKNIAEIYPFVYEQPQRAFFYAGSGFDDRIRLVKEHFDACIASFHPESLYAVYREEDLPLWETEFEGKKLRLVIAYEPGQRKEGILSVILRLERRPLYQIIFWLGRTPAIKKTAAENNGGKTDGFFLYIGAMQGPNGDEAKEIIKRLTKFCHGYRTKNLILYATQAVARSIGAAGIFAVTNKGYYANNHVRMDRKLKTSFSDFWQEAGGQTTEDERFDALPLVEERKTMEEVPTRKRAVYRRRFALLDEIDEAVRKSVSLLLG